MTPQQKALQDCIEALEASKNWHQGDKWRDDPDNRQAWEDHRDAIDAALNQAKQALDQFGDANKMVQAQGEAFHVEHRTNAHSEICDKNGRAYAVCSWGTDAAARAANICALLNGAHPQASEPVGINGLTQAETDASMSVRGLSNPTASEPAWRPIETAPKDGGILLGVWEGDWNNPKHRFRVYEATMYKTGPSWAMQGNYRTEEGGAYKIAGWLPLPAAPEAK